MFRSVVLTLRGVDIWRDWLLFGKGLEFGVQNWAYRLSRSS